MVDFDKLDRGLDIGCRAAGAASGLGVAGVLGYRGLSDLSKAYSMSTSDPTHEMSDKYMGWGGGELLGAVVFCLLAYRALRK